jgi:hypothetical protein
MTAILLVLAMIAPGHSYWLCQRPVYHVHKHRPAHRHWHREACIRVRS